MFSIPRRLYQYNDAGSEPYIETIRPAGGRLVAQLAEVAVEYPGFAPLV